MLFLNSLLFKFVQVDSYCYLIENSFYFHFVRKFHSIQKRVFIEIKSDAPGVSRCHRLKKVRP